MENKMTLEQFADLINSSDEWKLEFENIIKQNDWFADYEEKEEYKICQNGQELLYFDDNGKAQTRALREEEKMKYSFRDNFNDDRYEFDSLKEAKQAAKQHTWGFPVYIYSDGNIAAIVNPNDKPLP